MTYMDADKNTYWVDGRSRKLSSYLYSNKTPQDNPNSDVFAVPEDQAKKIARDYMQKNIPNYERFSLFDCYTLQGPIYDVQYFIIINDIMTSEHVSIGINALTGEIFSVRAYDQGVFSSKKVSVDFEKYEEAFKTMVQKQYGDGAAFENEQKNIMVNGSGKIYMFYQADIRKADGTVLKGQQFYVML